MRWLLFLPILVSAQTPDFDSEVAPLLEKRCLSCHSAAIPNASMDFRDRTSLVRTHAVVPGNPAESRIIRTVRHLGVVKMPPGGGKLPESDIAMLEAWIAGGGEVGDEARARAAAEELSL